jgi:hypothetical protein
VTRAMLGKVQLWTLIGGVVAAAVAWPLAGPLFAWGVLATALWAVIGFRALEGLVAAALVPPGEPRNTRAILIWAAVKIAVYGAATWVVFNRPFPPASHLVGVSLLLVAIVVQGVLLAPRGSGQPARRGNDG